MRSDASAAVERRSAGARGADEGADLVGVLLARRALDAGGDVDTRRPRDAQRLRHIAASRPPESMNGTGTSRPASSVPVERLAEPAGAGRILRRACVEHQPVGDLRVERGSAPDRRGRAIGSAFITGKPKRGAHRSTTRSGVSLPCSCSMSGCSAATMLASSRHRHRPSARPSWRAPAPAAPSARAASSPRWRGLGGKNTKPTMIGAGLKRHFERVRGLQAADFDGQWHDGAGSSALCRAPQSVSAARPAARRACGFRRGPRPDGAPRPPPRGGASPRVPDAARARRHRDRARAAASLPAAARSAMPPTITPRMTSTKISANSGSFAA